MLHSHPNGAILKRDVPHKRRKGSAWRGEHEGSVPVGAVTVRRVKPAPKKLTTAEKRRRALADLRPAYLT